MSAQAQRLGHSGWPQSPLFLPPQRHSLLWKILPSFPSTRRIAGGGAEPLAPQGGGLTPGRGYLSRVALRGWSWISG